MHVKSIYALLGITISLGLLGGCSKANDYTGRWECKKASGRIDYLEIKKNNGSFLVTDETASTYPAVLDQNGTLVLNGVPLMGSLPLPIDASSGQLICSTCSCKPYIKQPK